MAGPKSVNAYYIYIHPYLPLLPASNVQRNEDRHSLTGLPNEATEPTRADLSYWPKSSLGLALSALLVMIPSSQDPFPTSDMSVLVRRSFAQLFAQAALASVKGDIDDLGPGPNVAALAAEMSQEKSPLHSQVLSQLEPILALVVLSIYEYCQRGNVSRMRARINQAVTTAMDISLHNLESSATEHSEAQKRTWWITVSCAYGYLFQVAVANPLRCLWLTSHQISILQYGCRSKFNRILPADALQSHQLSL